MNHDHDVGLDLLMTAILFVALFVLNPQTWWVNLLLALMYFAILRLLAVFFRRR